MQFPVVPALIFAALIPAAFAWWRGRTIAARLDDPALAERLVVDRSRTLMVTCICAGFLIYNAAHLAWSLPLLLLSRIAAAYPLRVRLHEETWSLSVYLSFIGRMLLGVYGFWLLLGMTPTLANLAGSRDWIVAVALAAVLVAWNEMYGTVLCAVMGARAVTNPALVDRFERLRASCGLGPVRLMQVDLRGGVFANAVALPSPTRPAVLVSGTIVDRFDEDEAAAILAHELAHIEHFNPARLRTLHTVSFALIAAGTALTPVLRTTVPAALVPAFTVWPVALIVMMTMRAHQQQANETAADLRAIALTGDGGALVRALTRLHALGRVPRRLDAAMERQSTHPSLARRIQAIHAAEGRPPASLGEAATFDAASGTASVTFLDDRVEWNETAASRHVLAYAQLTMLRVDVRASGTSRLVATDRASRKWEMPLRQDDIARAQATLDIVDTRLAGIAPAPSVPPTVFRQLALITSFIAVTAGQYAVAFVALLAVVSPVLPLMAAAGAASVLAAALAGRERAALGVSSQPWLALALLVCGVAVIALAAVNGRERAAAVGARLGALIAAVACLAWIGIARAGFTTIDLHNAARSSPGAATLTIALAAMAAVSRTRRRYAAAPLAVAALAVAFTGSTAFVDRFVSDPLLAPAPAVAITTISSPAVAETRVAFGSNTLWVSPAGGFIAVGSEDEDEETTIHAGRPGRELAAFAADDAAFVDEGHLLLLQAERDASALRLVDLDANRTVWSTRVPFFSVQLSVDRVSRRWSMLGWNADDDVAGASGEVGTDRVRQQIFAATPAQQERLEPVAVTDRDSLLTLEHAVPPSLFDDALQPWMWLITSGVRVETSLRLVDGGTTSLLMKSRLVTRCHHLAGAGGQAICAAFDGSRTRFFDVDAAAPQARPLALVDGRFYPRADAGGGWIDGWWNGRQALVHPATQSALQVAPHDGAEATRLAIGDSVVAAVAPEGDGSVISVYRRPANSAVTAPSARRQAAR